MYLWKQCVCQLRLIVPLLQVMYRLISNWLYDAATALALIQSSIVHLVNHLKISRYDPLRLVIWILYVSPKVKVPCPQHSFLLPSPYPTNSFLYPQPYSPARSKPDQPFPWRFQSFRLPVFLFRLNQLGWQGTQLQLALLFPWCFPNNLQRLLCFLLQYRQHHLQMNWSLQAFPAGI